MEEELLKRWRLILGGDEADGTGVTLNLEEQRIDHSLEAVYDSDRRGGLGSSAPKVSRWLGVLSADSGTSDSAGCYKTSESDQSAYRKRNAGNGRPRCSSGCHPDVVKPGDS